MALWVRVGRASSNLLAMGPAAGAGPAPSGEFSPPPPFSRPLLRPGGAPPLGVLLGPLGGPVGGALNRLLLNRLRLRLLLLLLLHLPGPNSVRSPEVRDARAGAHSRPREDYGVLGSTDQVDQGAYLLVQHPARVAALRQAAHALVVVRLEPVGVARRRHVSPAGVGRRERSGDGDGGRSRRGI